jgi:archaellum biogenesis protein FlaJ (TadC family)
MPTLASEAGEVYGSFISAFTFTLAVTTVDKIVKSNSRNLVVLAITMAVAVALLTLVNIGVSRAADSLKASAAPSSALFAGPTSLLLFLVTTSRGIAVHFMSTIIGRWVLLLADGSDEPSLWSLMPTIAIGMSLVWLLGRATGVV